MSLPNPPKLFRCKKCNVYFYTFSTLEKPTHYKCHGHNTILTTKEEMKEIKQANRGI